MKKAIYIGNDTLREVIDRKDYGFVSDYEYALSQTKQHPITSPHSFEVGKEYVEGKDYRIYLIGASWCKTCKDYAELNCVKDHRSSIGHDRLVAIPLPKEPDEDELWNDVFEQHEKWHESVKDNRTRAQFNIDIMRQFHITKK